MANDEGKVWDSWEDMVDSGDLDKRLEKEEQTLQEQREKEATKCKQQPIVIEEDTHRTKYQPTLKLMRRENDEADGSNEQQPDVADTNKALSKTLAERQADYEEARLRILGAAKNEEDEEVDRSGEPGRKPKPGGASKQSKSSNNSGKSKKQKNTGFKAKKGSKGQKGQGSSGSASKR